MFKKIIFSILVYFLYFDISFAWWFDFEYNSTSWNPPVNCKWLPGCSSATNYGVVTKVSSNLIAHLIQYVAVFAVMALVISWVKYLISWWDEAKVKDAKNWIIWSLVWVFLSISAWAIINIINEFTIII